MAGSVKLIEAMVATALATTCRKAGASRPERIMGSGEWLALAILFPVGKSLSTLPRLLLNATRTSPHDAKCPSNCDGWIGSPLGSRLPLDESTIFEMLESIRSREMVFVSA